MVAAPMLQRGVEVNLPQARRSPEISSERIFVDVPATFTKDRRVMLDKEAIGLAALPERLKQLMFARADKRVFLRADGALSVQQLIDVLDQLKAAGVDAAGIVTELPKR
jgi:biopolymer transport protein ExbD